MYKVVDMVRSLNALYFLNIYLGMYKIQGRVVHIEQTSDEGMQRLLQVAICRQSCRSRLQRDLHVQLKCLF
jgi:hypothetical protein